MIVNYDRTVVIMIVNYDRTVIMIVNYDRKIFILQATDGIELYHQLVNILCVQTLIFWA